jgi:hypothetical protein
MPRALRNWLRFSSVTNFANGPTSRHSDRRTIEGLKE